MTEFDDAVARGEAMQRALAVADELHTLGAGTPEYAVDEVIGEGADIIRTLVAAVEGVLKVTDAYPPNYHYPISDIRAALREVQP